jgi:hypothetical protein
MASLRCLVLTLTGRVPQIRNKRALLIRALIWAVFLSGLLLEVFSSHLKIAHDSFVIPANMIPQGSTIDPRALVMRERTIQLCSAALVLAGAIGLAIYYRVVLLSSFRRKGNQ